jgi:hypothetical protein
MDLVSRDAFDTALIVVALVLVYSHSVSTTDPTTVVVAAIAALFSLDPLVYLMILGLAGILFMTYGVLYLPSQTGE